jgi:hypothetical protein
MKKLLSIIFLLFTLQIFAQGNLQFNGVKTYQGTLTCSLQLVTLDTVPQGKVWKIQSMGPSYSDYLTINNIPYINIYRGEVIGSSSTNGSYYGCTHINETPWLKSGDVIGWVGGTLFNPCRYGIGATTYYNISIVEYNIIP